VYLIEALLITRFLLKLLDANQSASFTDLIYTVSGVLVWPFITVLNSNYIAGSVIEWATLLAILVYWFLATALIKLLAMSRPISTQEADLKLSETEE